MANIQEAREAAAEFLRKALNLKEARVIGVTKADDGWNVEVEIYEESTFLKSLGLPTRVQDMNIYIVKLNGSLEVESYERQGHLAATR
jgi:alcohol dehydrogenase YqhD (iron-dependent ADH family)